MARVMALDIGHKRIGVAISDPAGIVAQPLCVLEWGTDGENKQLPDRNAVFEHIRTLCSRHQVEVLVVGLPRNMDASLGPQAQYVLEFVEGLQGLLDCRVVTVDERLTSQRAEQVLIEGDMTRKRRKQHIDKLAASLILRTYLDRTQSNN